MNRDADVKVWWGPPGAGKGTQADIDSEESGRPQLVASALLDAEIASGSERGEKMAACKRKGDLIPDDWINEMVRNEIVKAIYDRGVNLDGYPRTLGQSVGINQLLHSLGVRPLVVVCLKVDPKVVAYRLAHRLSCKVCPKTYHLIDNPPPKPYTCKCSGELYVRDDDKDEAVIANRLAKFEENSKPMIDYFTSTNQLITIECGALTMEQVTALIRAELAKRGR